MPSTVGCDDFTGPVPVDLAEEAPSPTSNKQRVEVRPPTAPRDRKRQAYWSPSAMFFPEPCCVAHMRTGALNARLKHRAFQGWYREGAGANVANQSCWSWSTVCSLHEEGMRPCFLIWPPSPGSSSQMVERPLALTGSVAVVLDTMAEISTRS